MPQTNTSYPAFSYDVQRPTGLPGFDHQASHLSSNGSQNNVPSPFAIMRFHDEAWNPLHLPSADINGGTLLHQPNASYQPFPPQPSSVASAAHLSDSGYQTHSSVSNDPALEYQSHGSRSSAQQITSMNAQPPNNGALAMACKPSDLYSQRGCVSSRGGTQVNKFQCQTCDKILKRNSDYKKHMLRHEKPFRCEEFGCKREGEGFATVNDLDRHKMSVHCVGLYKKWYQCASETCSKQEKTWTRLDNFKKHIERMHKEEDQIDLFKRSTSIQKQQEVILENNSVAPIETMLAGMDHWPAATSSTSDFLNFHQTSASTCGFGQPYVSMENPRADHPESQTKVQKQQRQALKKLSEALSKEMNSSVDLEVFILRSLARTTDSDEGEIEQPENDNGTAANRTQGCRSSKVFLTKSEAIKAAQMISNLIKQSPGSAFSQPQARKMNRSFTTNTKVCDICQYAAARACDLKKHMKRHEKPYGCTYPKCYKRFGAKSDWKRHENSQHFQLEAFRCGQKSSAGQVCGEHFLRIELFKTHLEDYHKMCQPENREDEAKARRIGKNCQIQFWCGFHNDIIVLKEKRNAAWDERFDHIASHIEENKRSIEEWVCVEGNKTKQVLLKEMDRYVFNDEDKGTSTAGRSSPPLSLTEINVAARPYLERPLPAVEVDSMSDVSKFRKRLPSEALEPPQVQRGRHRKTIISSASCCECNNPYGPFQTSCINCEHKQCANCEIEHTEVTE